MNIDTKMELQDKLSAIREALLREYWEEYYKIAKTEFPTTEQPKPIKK